MWDAEDKVWWMPADMLQLKVNNPPAQWSGPKDPTIEQYLNHQKMVVGQYGDFAHSSSASIDLLGGGADEDEHEDYYLSNNSKTYLMRIHINYDVAHVFETTGNSGKYMNREDGRKRWEELVKEGYNRTISA
jgi:hypothetical protein